MSKLSTHKHTKRLVLLSLLTAIALTLFVVEAQITLPIAIPGIKLGLANIVTLFLIVEFSPKEAIAVLLMRIVLGSLFTGQLVTLTYSLAGGLLSTGVMLLCNYLLKGKSIWFTSILGGVFHNVGQILVAFFYLSVGGVLYYLPFLFVSGILMGGLMGIATQTFLRAWMAIDHSSNRRSE